MNSRNEDLSFNVPILIQPKRIDDPFDDRAWR
ncbi:protein of unknown function [Pseudodesulfovibrio profundus]|uniref:Uncharacterized protein n=1 Tax=Pseudodesulfovibrio profundus TaxID=57320 RepID=A0A2C8F4U4_9BACT|nr:protein of unknown function [Pseudodesulfovibrio profundus]